MRISSVAILAVVAATIAVGLAPVHAARRYVLAPQVSWEEILPYLQSNVGVFIHDQVLEVVVCTESQDRTGVIPYATDLGEYARLILFEALRRSGRMDHAIEEVVVRFRTVLPTLSVGEKHDLPHQLWKTLVNDLRFIGPVREAFDRAKKAGRLRCRLCEKGMELEFLHLL